MGLPNVEDAVAYLTAVGIRTARGYPGARMPQITGTVAAVNVEKLEAGKRTLVAYICGPWKQGAEACERTAFHAAEAWTSAGATCTYGGCEFDGKSGMYILRVLGVWEEAAATVEEAPESASDGV